MELDLNDELEFLNMLKAVFSTANGLRVLSYLLDLCGWGGQINNQFNAGRRWVADQIMGDMIKAAPETVQEYIAKLNQRFVDDRMARHNRIIKQKGEE